MKAKASTPGSSKVTVNVRSTHIALLPDELIEPLVGDAARAVGGDVQPGVTARCRAVDRNAEADRAAGRRTEDEVQVPGLEAIGQGCARRPPNERSGG